ncbi:cytochrome-c peroxidase [Methylobacterium sp. sgz302541]|uniref:cytochrome-c peroxidase n=1 Tax=unclassified Methylobacterium TaxID=2615210 RepID=UPI003D358D31
MTWKLGGAAAALLMVLGAAGYGAMGPDRLGDETRAAYRRPAAIPFPEENAYSLAKAELGRRLFFDPLLSGERDRTCASCHNPDHAWGDSRARAEARDGLALPRRTPTLLNLAWQERLGWDGKFRDLDTVAFTPITSERMMNLPEAEALARLAADPDYAKGFADAFPDPAVTRERVEAALATFERLIVSPDAPFDRWIAGDETAVDAKAKHGFALFTGKAGCAACHSGWAFSDGSFHDIGSATGEDIGRGKFFPNSPALRYAFKTPGLRQVTERGPYMHDGSVPTLEAVIDLYNCGGIDRPSRSKDIRALALSPGEKADIVAFLKTLSADKPARVAEGGFPATAPQP